VKVHLLERSQRLPAPPCEVFPFFGDARNLEAITPPWLAFRVLAPDLIRPREGALIAYRLRLHGLPIRWLTRIDEWVPGERFVDRQVRGPYALWHHTHAFEADDDGGTVMRDTVRYSIPFGPLGTLARAAVVRRDLDRIFDYRRDAVLRYFTK
jgi:ligand-binding SRPBCC domain-containing protein